MSRDGWAQLAGSMPLDTPDRVRAAWSMINRPIVHQALQTEMLVREDVTEAFVSARVRIQLAAIEHGLGLLPEP